VYPILKLNSDKMTMKNVINELLHLTQTTLEETFQIDELTTENALLGLWREKKKLASVGVALDRYVTFHGLALNLEFDDKMKSVLAHLFPCGISSDTYQDVASLTNSSNLAPAFHESFVKNLSSSLFNS
jgi:lipoate-protein ligase B